MLPDCGMPTMLPDDTAARIARARLEGDGIASSLFELLWRRDLLSECSLAIRIPDTVIYSCNAPTVWYFTSVDGTIKRKSKAKVNSDHILAEFRKRPSPSGIVAYFVATAAPSPRSDAGHHWGSCASLTGAPREAGVSTRTTVEYLDAEALELFLTSRLRSRCDGILQRFLEPKGDYNNMLRAMWSPKVCILERRINRLRASDTRYDIYERAVTFEGPDFHSEMTPVRGPALASKVHEIAESIVQHVAAVTGDRIQVSRLTLNFKVDSKDRMWLLFASSVRLHDEFSRSLQDGKTTTLALPQKGLCNTPLEVNTALGVPDHVRRAGTVQRSRPARLQLTCKCPTCLEKKEEGTLCEISYKILIDYVEHQRGTGKPLPGLPAETTVDSARVVPEVLQRIHPRLTPDDYMRHRFDVAFLHQTAEVCEACYLKFSAPQLGVRCWRDLAADPAEEKLSLEQRAAEAILARQSVDAGEKGFAEEARNEGVGFSHKDLDPTKLTRRRSETRKRISEQKADEDDAWDRKRKEQPRRGTSCPKLPSWAERSAIERTLVVPPAPIRAARAPPRPSGVAPLWCDLRLHTERELPLNQAVDPQRSHRRVPPMRGAPYLRELQNFAAKCSSRAPEVLPSRYVEAMDALGKAGQGKRDGCPAPTDWLLRHPALSRCGGERGEGAPQRRVCAEEGAPRSILASLKPDTIVEVRGQGDEEEEDDEDEEVRRGEVAALRASVTSMWSKWPYSRGDNAKGFSESTTRPPSQGGATTLPSSQPSTRPSSRPASRLQSAASASARPQPGCMAFSPASTQDHIFSQSRPSSSPHFLAGNEERPPSREASHLHRPASSPAFGPRDRSTPRRPGSAGDFSEVGQRGV